MRARAGLQYSSDNALIPSKKGKRVVVTSPSCFPRACQPCYNIQNSVSACTSWHMCVAPSHRVSQYITIWHARPPRVLNAFASAEKAVVHSVWPTVHPHQFFTTYPTLSNQAESHAPCGAHVQQHNSTTVPGKYLTLGGTMLKSRRRHLVASVSAV